MSSKKLKDIRSYPRFIVVPLDQVNVTSPAKSYVCGECGHLLVGNRNQWGPHLQHATGSPGRACSQYSGGRSGTPGQGGNSGHLKRQVAMMTSHVASSCPDYAQAQAYINANTIVSELLGFYLDDLAARYALDFKGRTGVAVSASDHAHRHMSLLSRSHMKPIGIVVLAARLIRADRNASVRERKSYWGRRRRNILAGRATKAGPHRRGTRLYDELDREFRHAVQPL